MKSTNPYIARFLAVSALALALPLSALAAVAEGQAPQFERADCCMDAWGGPQHRHHRGEHEFGRHGALPSLMMLRGLDLTEAQRGQIKEILQAQRPELGEKMRAVRDTRVALQKLTLSDSYTEKRASAMAATLAQQEGDLVRLMAEQGNKVYQLLTPEQRSQVQERLTAREARLRQVPPAPPARS